MSQLDSSSRAQNRRFGLRTNRLQTSAAAYVAPGHRYLRLSSILTTSAVAIEEKPGKTGRGIEGWRRSRCSARRRPGRLRGTSLSVDVHGPNGPTDPCQEEPELQPTIRNGGLCGASSTFQTGATPTRLVGAWSRLTCGQCGIRGISMCWSRSLRYGRTWWCQSSIGAAVAFDGRPGGRGERGQQAGVGGGGRVRRTEGEARGGRGRLGARSGGAPAGCAVRRRVGAGLRPGHHARVQRLHPGADDAGTRRADAAVDACQRAAAQRAASRRAQHSAPSEQLQPAHPRDARIPGGGCRQRPARVRATHRGRGSRGHAPALLHLHHPCPGRPSGRHVLVPPAPARGHSRADRRRHGRGDHRGGRCRRRPGGQGRRRHRGLHQRTQNPGRQGPRLHLRGLGDRGALRLRRQRRRQPDAPAAPGGGATLAPGGRDRVQGPAPADHRAPR